MSHSENKAGFGKKVMGAALSVCLAVGLAPSVALAADHGSSAPTSVASTTNGSGVKYLTGAACRAAMPITEILGISGIEETGNFVNLATPLNSSSTNPSSKYYLMGTSVNQNPNPYMANTNYAAYHTDATVSDDVKMVSNPSRSGGGAGPDAALDYIGRTYTDEDGEIQTISTLTDLDSTDLAVWNRKPDVVIGDASGSVNYASTVSQIGSYSTPSVKTYSFSKNKEIVDTMYKTAAGADALVSAGRGVLRYSDSASTIALKYERFIKGAQGYVLSQLGTNAKKKVAVITGKNADGTYKIAKSKNPPLHCVGLNPYG